MSCPTELTLSIYADRELTLSEQQRVAGHLAECSNCQSLLEALEQENAVLMEVLHAEPVRAVAGAARARGAGWLWGALALVALAPLALQGAWRTLPSLPAGLGWLKNLTGPLEILAVLRGVWRLAAEGEDMLLTACGFMVTLVVGVCLLATSALRKPELARLGAGVAAALLLGLTLPNPAHAAEIRSQEGGTIRIAASETVDDDAFLSGKSVVVAGVVEGDVFVAAERVEVTGNVRGNLYSASGFLKLTGQVAGNVHAVGEQLELTGTVGGSGYMAGENVTLSAGSEIVRGAYLAGESLNMAGRIGRDAYLAAESLEISGQLARSATACANQFALASSAVVGGDVKVTVPEKDAAVIDDGARVTGKTNVEVKQEEERHDFLHAGFYLAVLARVLALLVLGLLTVTLFPAALPQPPSTSMQLLRNMGLGFVVLVATPVAAVLVALTVIGIPVAIVVIMLYAILAYASTLVVAYFIGLRLPAQTRARSLLNTALVLLCIILLTELPLVGFGLNFMVHLVGVGCLVMHFKERFRRPEALTPGS